MVREIKTPKYLKKNLFCEPTDSELISELLDEGNWRGKDKPGVEREYNSKNPKKKPIRHQPPLAP